jgi:serine/threonine protein kinase
MSDDLTQTQAQGDESWQRARETSLRHRLPPAQVHGYEIERCLGEGAYGEVWLAKIQNNPGRRVAIKFYTRRSRDWALLAREVEKLNFLATDRYVVQLLDVGWNADPPYYVMEYMEKGSLAERLEAGTMRVPEAVAMFREVARGVVSAHNRGVLHCDLKPANVLLGLDGRPRLADFGQSRLSHEQMPALGTLFYMAPEQADLKATPDARWDVYALGALLYCLITGEPPHRDLPGVDTLEEPVALEERLARYRRMLEQAHRPRKHRRCPGMDRALVEITDRCLAVNPAKRYPNVQAVLDALDARALRRARRPLLVLGALAPVLLLLLMGGVVRQELSTAVIKSSEALTKETQVSNLFAAQAVAEKVAGKIDRRWRTLEQEAADPGFQALLKAARSKSLGTPEQKALQARMERMPKDHPEVAAESWVAFDDTGALRARSPHEERVNSFIGRNYAHRDFFSGLDRQLDEKKDAPSPALTHPHRSMVFDSNITHTRKVAFSVPVWEGKPASPDQPRLGVLTMTVEVGGFAELESSDGSSDYIAVLVDCREDSSGRRGAILEHPRLAELRKRKVPEQNLQFFVQLDRLVADSWDPDYRDPVGHAHADYSGRWLAASHPVKIEERRDNADTGWLVVVQERHETVIGPVLALEADMMHKGWWALGLALTVVTVLWVFVIIVLNESSGSRLLAFLRRRAGITPDSTPSQRASGGYAPKQPVPAEPWVPTVTERPN